MPRDLRCPNPGCTHVFAADAVAGVAALVCPRCGGVFQVKVRPAGPAAPVAAAPPPARRFPIVRWLTVGLVVFGSVGLMLAAVFRPPTPPPSEPELYRSTEHNYALRPPGLGWQQDDDLARRLGGVLAFRHENPEARLVLCVRDYPSFVPTAAELHDEAVARLKKVPVNNLRCEDKPEEATFGGKPARRLVFQGTIDGTVVSGDVETVFHQGKAYWLVRWCPTAVVEPAAVDLADLTGRFTLLDLRPDWRPPRRAFLGSKQKYALTAEGDRWDKAPFPPESFDPAADLALSGRADRGPIDPARQAVMLVLILPKGAGEPVQRATAHLLIRQKELYPETSLTVLPSPAGGGNEHGTVELRVTNTKSRERFVLLRAVPRPDSLLVLWGECDFARRDLWEADLVKLVGSLKVPD